ncbi:MAG: tRNA lysidine(34) synthetase TilS [Gammaproteobacteria bacterium]|nr:tRNA lysidine(34) synthetase TilS [Gammaproteobacteria bacterium]MDH5652838.1 tRNA lysidine(34) synthetase TilS [Gammaproteobacteria bacterium]
MSFTSAHLQQALARFPAVHRYLIAFSGGCDSRVLLHALAALRSHLNDVVVQAVHVNHGLQARAGEWEQHCQTVCDELNIPLHILRVDATAQPGESREAAARRARYYAFKSLIKSGDMLLLAHHADDQAETLLLQLLRGAGAKGLAAMPGMTEFGGGWLGRPLLHESRANLQHYAEQYGLDWIEDPSNADEGFDRNYLRHRVMPLLTARWPSAVTTLGRSAGHLAESAALLAQLAEQDWQQCRDAHNRLQLTGVQQLNPARQRNLLRYWLVSRCSLTCPDSRHLNRILHEVLPAGDSATPVVGWSGGEVRRYRGLLYAMSPQATTTQTPVTAWDGLQPLPLSGGKLVSHPAKGEGLDPARCAAPLTVRFRAGGEICKPVGRGHHHSLKKLFQEWGVPPWQRQQVPLIYAGDEIAQVVGYCICEPFQTAPQKQGLVIQLENNS